MRVAILITVALLASAVPASAARKAPAPVSLAGSLIEHSPTGFGADGERYATGTTLAGGSVVWDDGGASPRRLTTSCVLGNIYHGTAKAVCALQLGVVTLPSLTPVALLGLSSSDTVDPYVGTHWTTAGDSAGQVYVIDWHTGTRTPVPSARDTYDLNHVPLRKLTLAVGSTLTGIADPRVLATDRQWPTIRLRQKTRTIVVRRRCQGTYQCIDVQYGGGIVSWVEDDAACAFVVKTARTGCWKPTPAQWAQIDRYPHGLTDTVLSPSHTSRALYVTALAKREGDPSAPAPGAPPQAATVIFRMPLGRLLHG